jgi:hypothetical protein
MSQGLSTLWMPFLRQISWITYHSVDDIDRNMPLYPEVTTRYSCPGRYAPDFGRIEWLFRFTRIFQYKERLNEAFVEITGYTLSGSQLGFEGIPVLSAALGSVGQENVAEWILMVAVINRSDSFHMHPTLYLGGTLLELYLGQRLPTLWFQDEIYVGRAKLGR